MKKIYSFIPFLLCLFSWTKPTASTANQPRVTVWIHGTQPKKLLPTLGYIETIEYFQSYVPGLASIKQVPEKAFLHAIAHSLCDASPELFPYEHFYQFGWDGDATVPVRRTSGHALYIALKKLVVDYAREYGCLPIITLISHSHGGNVILHMHEAFTQDKEAPSLLIDKAILLACPIQVETIDYITSPLFNSILNIYSKDDTIQVIDPQWLQPFIGAKKKAFSKAWNAAMKRPWFSKRQIPQLVNTKNIQVSWCSGAPWQDCTPYLSKKKVKTFKMMSDAADFFSSKRGLSHIEIQLPFFLKHMPAIMHHASLHNSTMEKVTLDSKLLIQIT